MRLLHWVMHNCFCCVAGTDMSYVQVLSSRGIVSGPSVSGSTLREGLVSKLRGDMSQ